MYLFHMCINFFQINILLVIINLLIWSASSRRLIDYLEAENSDPQKPVLPSILQIPNTRFYILRRSVSWSQGVKICAALNLKLASFRSKEEIMNALLQLKSISEGYHEEYDNEDKSYEFGLERRYWIGLTDVTNEGVWVWTGWGQQLAEELEDLWYKGQPDHYAKKTSTHCGTLWNPNFYSNDHHHFDDDDCVKSYYALCGDDSLPTPLIFPEVSVKANFPGPSLSELSPPPPVVNVVLSFQTEQPSQQLSPDDLRKPVSSFAAPLPPMLFRNLSQQVDQTHIAPVSSEPQPTLTRLSDLNVNSAQIVPISLEPQPTLTRFSDLNVNSAQVAPISSEPQQLFARLSDLNVNSAQITPNFSEPQQLFASLSDLNPNSAQITPKSSEPQQLFARLSDLNIDSARFSLQQDIVSTTPETAGQSNTHFDHAKLIIHHVSDDHNTNFKPGNYRLVPAFNSALEKSSLGGNLILVKEPLESRNMNNQFLNSGIYRLVSDMSPSYSDTPVSSNVFTISQQKPQPTVLYAISPQTVDMNEDNQLQRQAFQLVPVQSFGVGNHKEDTYVGNNLEKSLARVGHLVMKNPSLAVETLKNLNLVY